MNDSPPTVLIVDDDESVRKAMRRLLMSYGYRVFTFQTAEDVLLSGVVRGDVCLLLDICLPGLSGFVLYSRLTASGVKCPVIFMTAHDDPLYLRLAEQAGAVALLRKPFDEQSLLDAIVLSGMKKEGRFDTVHK